MTITKKILLMMAALLLLTVGAGALYGVSLWNYSTGAFSKTFRNLDDEELTAIDATKPLTILLMGVDMDQATRGGDWTEGRSDSMILVTVNPLTKETNMMSLTRDIMVEIANADGTSSGTVEKLNHSYSYGQAPMAIATVEKMMDIEIDRYIEINMDGLVELVDAVGGITVNNTLGFPISIEEQEPAYTSVVPPGVQLVNGDQALVYARMRYDDPEGDIGRQRRQREVITAIVKKLLQLEGFTQYKKVLTAISNNMRTNIAITSQTIPELLGYKDSLNKLYSYQLQGENQIIDEIFYQLPLSQHVLDMQNVLKKALGKAQVIDLVTNIKVLESQFDYPSAVTIYDAYTKQLLLEKGSSGSSVPYVAESGTVYDSGIAETNFVYESAAIGTSGTYYGPATESSSANETSPTSGPAVSEPATVPSDGGADTSSE